MVQGAVGRFWVSCPCLRGSRLTWEEPLKWLQLLARGTKEALIRPWERRGRRRRQERGSEGPASTNQTRTRTSRRRAEPWSQQIMQTFLLSYNNKMFMNHNKSTFSFLSATISVPASVASRCSEHTQQRTSSSEIQAHLIKTVPPFIKASPFAWQTFRFHSVWVVKKSTSQLEHVLKYVWHQHANNLTTTWWQRSNETCGPEGGVVWG